MKSNESFIGFNGEEFNLETYLWESANILRGNVDASDFKAYIFPLLFYKRISDVYDEEYSKALEESNNDEEYARSEVNHRFQIPDGAHWNDLRIKTKNIGQHLQKALRSIERANPTTLFGIFGDTNWGNKEILDDEVISNLIDHFSKIKLTNSNVESDILGRAYEYLIKKFADLTNKKAGEFYTPRSVVRLMVEILDVNDSETVFDPACGTGGMLLEALSHVKRKNQDFRKLKLYGHEENLTTSGIARINLFLHGIDDFKIVRCNTLKDPAFHTSDNLAQFDCVIANPPYSLKKWGYEIWKSDPYKRTILGLPPEGNGDYAWLQHMILSTNDRGRMIVVLSNGALTRKVEEDLRKKLLHLDILVSVIRLGPNLFYGGNVYPSILFFKKKKSDEEKGNILMINATSLFKAGRTQNTLQPEHQKKVVDTLRNRDEEKGFSRIVTIREIEENDYDLSASRYVSSEDDNEGLSIDKALSELKMAFEVNRQNEERIRYLLIRENILNEK